MKIKQEAGSEEEHRTSPKGRFEIYRRHMSIALGGKKDVGTWGGGFPFDVELARIPAGKINYPLHAHAAQWEYYIVLSGAGTIVDSEGRNHDIGKGSHVVCPPNEAHQIKNTGDEDLTYYIVSDHHPADVITYPKTGKRLIKPEYRVLSLNDIDYYEGEE